MRLKKQLSCMKESLCKLLVFAMIVTQLSGLGFAADSSSSVSVAKAEETGASVGTLSGTGYTVLQSATGSSISYTAGTWNPLDATVSNHDAAAQNKLQIVVTPAAIGMNLGVCYNGDNYLRTCWDSTGVFSSSGEQTLIYDLPANVTSLRFYCDPPTTVTTATGSQTFGIKSITFLDTLGYGVKDGITFDGANLDWDYFTKLSADKGAFTQVAAFKTDERLYLMYELKDASTYYNDQILINADGDSTNGYLSAGADYLIQGSTLYAYNGSTWTATGYMAKTASTNNKIAEFIVPLSCLGSPTGDIGVNVGVVKSDWSYLGCYPASSTAFAAVPTYIAAYHTSTAAELTAFNLTTVSPLKAITSNTLKGGEIGTFSVSGGDGTNYTYSLLSSSLYGADNSKFTISGNKLYLADKVLPPGNYSVYMKVASDIRTVRKQFTFTVDAADKDSVISEAVFEGKANEWFAVDYNAANEVLNLTGLKAVSDGTDLYGYVSSNLLSNQYEIYFNVAGAAGKDLSGIWSDGSSVAYKLDSTQNIYQWSNNAWVDTTKDAIVHKTNAGAEFKLAISDISAVSSTAVKVGVKEGAHTQLPNKGQSMLQVQNQSGLALSMVDGVFTDWDVITNSVGNTAAAPVYNLYATMSQDSLYTLVVSDNADLNTLNTYYLDTNSATGSTYGSYAGVDYIVKDAELYPVTANNTLGNQLCTVDMNYYKNAVEMIFYLDEINDPSTINIAYEGKGGNLVLPASPTYMQVTSSFEMYRDSYMFYPTQVYDSLSNPYKGWVTWGNRAASASAIAYEYETVYIGIKWSELEAVKGVYDFDYVEDLYNFDYWLAQGKKINLRFIMDNPLAGYNGIRKDIPQWLYDELVTEMGVGNEGTFYYGDEIMSALGGSGFSPNYNSQLLLHYHELAIQALASRYDDTEKIAFVQIGSLGHWGEFHTWPTGSGIFPSPTVAAQYMAHYTTYFHNVKLGLRKPYPYAAANGFGLFNDIFGVSQYSGTYTFLDYINNGDTDMGSLSTAADVENSAMPDFWKTNYSGGEFAEGDIRLHITNDGIMGCLQQIRDTHVSWLGPCSPTNMYTTDSDAYTYKANILAIQKLMGYRFALESITHTTALSAGESVPITMVWNNKGVAPFYYEWPMELSLINSNGTVTYSQSFDVDVTEWLPGRIQKSVTLNVPTAIASGNYTLAVAFLNKDTSNPDMALAIDNERSDMRYELYDVTIN